MNDKERYNFSFTTGTLMPAEMLLLAKEYLRIKDWNALQGKCSNGTILTFRTLASCRDIGRRLISRLKEFSLKELEYFVAADLYC